MLRVICGLAGPECACVCGGEGGEEGMTKEKIESEVVS